MDNDNHDNVINAYIPRKDAKVDDLYLAICEAIEDNKDGLARAAIIGVLAIIQSDWINKVMDYGFHHNKPTEVRLVKATKAILVPAPEPVLYHRSKIVQRANGKVHVIETSTACSACAGIGHVAACRFCSNRKS